jgi:hypothetical protein
MTKPRRFLRSESQQDVTVRELNPYEPPTSQYAPLALVDYQVGLMTGARDYSTGETACGIQHSPNSWMRSLAVAT